MSGTRLAAPLRPVAALRIGDTLGPLVGPALVLAATCFNLVLCYVNTQHWAEIGTGPVVGVSLVIVAAGLAAVHRSIGTGLAGSAVLVVLVTLALRLLNPDLDLKILFDLLIAPVFVLLGRRSTAGAADRMLGLLMAIVVAVGFMELLLPDVFQTTFDILSFYTSKGAVSADAINYGGTRFFASAERAENAGRTLLPWLFGPHRVSSIFLEPISMGNFALICLAWLLSVPRRWSPLRVTLAVGTVLCVVFPDSRQASAAGLLMLALRFGPWSRSRLLAAALPVAMMLVLLGFGIATLESTQNIGIVSDDFQGRLLFSGQLLASWGWPEWFGLAPSDVYTADTGYAYLVNNLGLPLALFVWLRGITLPALSMPQARMRGMLGLYAATSLCVGASLFSIKTAALLWFLYGAAQGANQDVKA